jgi:hypothetical protein
MTVRRPGNTLTILALIAVFVLAEFGSPTRADADEPTPMVLTIITADGNLWALPDGQPPVLLRRNVAKGTRVADITWHPTSSEFLMVRQSWIEEAGARYPYDTLVRLDLETGTEQVIFPEVGPQARLLTPRYGPGGDWAYARMECCLAHAVVFFEGSAPKTLRAGDFLAPATEEITLVSAGPVSADGRIVMAVQCCLGDQPEQEPSGLYLASRDLVSAERLTTGAPIVPIGVGPGGAWIAGLRTDPRDEAGAERWSLVTVQLPGAEERPLLPFDQIPLAEKGAVAADGTIAVATRMGDPSQLPIDLLDLWVIQPDGTNLHNLTEGRFPGFTAFAWAPSTVLDRAPRP